MHCHNSHDKPKFLFSSAQCLLPSNLVLVIIDKDGTEKAQNF